MTKQLALVVHGIGEQQAGETVHHLVGGLTGKDGASVKTDMRLLHETNPQSEPDPTPALFPCHISRVEHDKGETVFAEVYWADLSGGNTGALRTIYDIVTLSLGFGHISRRNAEAVHDEDHWLTKLTKAVTHLLHGPITAGNAMLLLGFALLAFTPLSDHHHYAAWTIAVIAIVVGFLALGRLRERHLFQIFSIWLFGLGALFAIFTVYTMTSGQGIAVTDGSCGGDGWCEAPWYAMFFIVILSLSGAAILLIAPVLVIAQWRNDRQQGQGRAGFEPPSLFHVVSAFMVVMWLLIATVLWVFVFRTFDSQLAAVGISFDLLETSAPLMGLFFGCLVALALAGGLIGLRVMQWHANYKSQPNIAGEPPRLILNPIFRMALSLVVVILGLAIIMSAAEIFGIVDMSWLGGMTETFSTLAISAALLAATLYSAFANEVAKGVAVAKDVVAFFKREPKEPKTERRWHTPKMREMKTDPKWHDPLRDRMRARFAAVAAVMIDSERPDEVVIVSHSLGTMIATDAIRDDEIYQLLIDRPNAQNPVLVTMGSPYTHMFTQYFGKFFEKPAFFKSRLSRWLNIYRADDFVGTAVEGEDDQWPENCRVPPRGHTGYWSDADVIKLLKPGLFDLSASGSETSASESGRAA